MKGLGLGFRNEITNDVCSMLYFDGVTIYWITLQVVLDLVWLNIIVIDLVGNGY